MTDDNFESFLQRVARDYNAPPPTPRDAMWARIEAERRDRRTSAAIHGAHVRRWLAVGVAIAAMLLVGIGIGYFWRGTMDSHLVAEGPNRSTDSAHQRLAGTGGEPANTGTHDSSSRHRNEDASRTPKERGLPSSSPLAPDSRFAVVPRAPGSATIGEPESSTSRPDARGMPGSSPAVAGDRRVSAAYAALTAEHLGRVEMLLTTYRAESESGSVDPQVTSWAGDLLGTTRLLLDSPGASDPRLRKLLGDLEVVLTQITQLGVDKGSRKDELQLIDQSLRSHDVMTRIRGATPAGAGALPIGT